MKKKSKLGVLIPIIFLLLGLVGLFFAARSPWLHEQPAYAFVNGLLRDFISASPTQSPRRENKIPEALTNDQRYPGPLVPQTAINLLIIGPDQSGANWDTLLIVSLDEETGELRLINLPRDLYVDYSPAILQRLGDASPKTLKSVPARKINAAHLIGQRIAYREKGGRFKSPELDFTADLIEEMLQIRIDECLLVQPSGFRNIVDHFGGVRMEVPYRMKYSDPLQNLRIDLQPGLQLLTGAQAEGFVRFRQGTDDNGKSVSIGDVERKKNQTAFVKAFLSQHATVANLGQATRLVAELDKYYETTITGAERYGSLAGIVLSMLGKGLQQVEVPIVCEPFKKEGIYFLQFAPPTGEKKD